MNLNSAMKKENDKILINLCEHLIRQYQRILDAEKIENITITFTADGEIFNINETTIPITLRNDIRSIANDCMKETESFIQEIKSRL